MRFLSLPLSVLLHVGLIVVVTTFAWRGAERETIYVPPVPIEVISKAELADEISIPETRVDEPVEPPAAEEEVDSPPERTIDEVPPAPAEPVETSRLAPGNESEKTEDPAEESPAETNEPEEPPKVEEAKSDPPVTEEDDLLAGLEDSLVNLDPDKDRGAPRVVSATAPVGERDQERVGTGETLSVTEEVLLAACVRENYILDKTARGWETFFIRVRVKLNIDGSLTGPVEVLNQREINLAGNPAYQAAARNAVAAITSCFPLDGLDPARYSAWDQFTYDFKPEDF